MGFWATVLVALRFKSDQVPVVSEPLHSFRKWLNSETEHRVRVNTVTVQKIQNDVELVHRVRLEAR